MEIATAKIKIKDHKEEITKVIEDIYFPYGVEKKDDCVYVGHAGIIGIFAIEILDKLKEQGILNSLLSFNVTEIIDGNIETEDYLEGYENGYK